MYIHTKPELQSSKSVLLCGTEDRRPRGLICLILSPSQNCCHSHCVNKSMAWVKCEKREVNYAPCGIIPPRKQHNQQPTNNCTLFCCQKEQLSLWALQPSLRNAGTGCWTTCAVSALWWGLERRANCTCCTCKAMRQRAAGYLLQHLWLKLGEKKQCWRKRFWILLCQTFSLSKRVKA